MRFEGDPREWYFVLVEEWLVPNESGRDVSIQTYDTLDSALEAAREYLESEAQDFASVTGLKPTSPAKYGDLMYVMTPGEGQDDEWYDCVKVIPVACGIMPITGYSPEKPARIA